MTAETNDDEEETSPSPSPDDGDLDDHQHAAEEAISLSKDGIRERTDDGSSSNENHDNNLDNNEEVEASPDDGDLDDHQHAAEEAISLSKDGTRERTDDGSGSSNENHYNDLDNNEEVEERNRIDDDEKDADADVDCNDDADDDGERQPLLSTSTSSLHPDEMKRLRESIKAEILLEMQEEMKRMIEEMTKSASTNITRKQSSSGPREEMEEDQQKGSRHKSSSSILLLPRRLSHNHQTSTSNKKKKVSIIDNQHASQNSLTHYVTGETIVEVGDDGALTTTTTTNSNALTTTTTTTNSNQHYNKDDDEEDITRISHHDIEDDHARYDYKYDSERYDDGSSGFLQRLFTKASTRSVRHNSILGSRSSIFGHGGLPTMSEDKNENQQQSPQQIQQQQQLLTVKDIGKIQKLPPDTYSFLVSSCTQSSPFVLGISVACIQALLFGLLAKNQWDGDGDNPTNLPANVEPPVRLTQVLAVVIAVFVQDDLQVSLERFKEGYLSLDRFVYASKFKWYLAILLRGSLGGLGLFVAFLLIVDADNVFDLLLNFTGVAFVSELDEICLLLSVRGYFGKECLHEAKHIRNTKYTVAAKISHTAAFCTRPIILGFMALILYCGLMVVIFAQASGKYICHTLKVEFTDQVVPVLGTYSGLYRLDGSDRYDGRITYKEVLGLHTVVQKGEFGYCDEEDAWTFFTSTEEEHDHCYFGPFCLYKNLWRRDQDDPCVGYLAKSFETSSFDLLDTASEPWYSADGIQLQNIKFTCEAFARHNAAATAAAVAKNLTKDFWDDICPELIVLGDTVFDDGRAWSKTYKMLRGGNSMVRSYDRPIYAGRKQFDDGHIDLILFTGRRWIATDTSHFQEFQNFSNRSEVLDAVAGFFQSRFHASQLPNHSITFISEAVNTATDSLTPVGLTWYHAVYPEENDSVDVELLFPRADDTRTVSLYLSCKVCDNEANPCFYDGYCDEETRTCSCVGGATGVLCEIEPLDNGRCDNYFNSESFQYDGGDCCGATCNGPACDVQMDSIFGVQGYGSIDGIATGFPECADSAMVPISLQINGRFAARMRLVCEEKVYLTIGATHDSILPLSSEIVLVKDGVECELRFDDIFEWDVSLIQIRYLVGSEHEHALVSYETPPGGLESYTLSIKFSIISSCLLIGLAGIVTDDFATLTDFSSREAKAIKWLNSYVHEGSVCDNPRLPQQYAMAALSFSGWFNPQRHCEWPVVQCNPDGGVTRIMLLHGFFENVTQTILYPELRLLTELESLDLPNFNISGTIPSFLGSLSILEHLDLSQNSLTGTIPKELASLPRLHSLDFSSNNNLKVPSELESLCRSSSEIVCQF